MKLSSIQYGQSFLVIDKLPPLHKLTFTADACITFENSSQVLNYMSGRPFCKCFAQLHTSRFFRKTKFHSVAFLKCHLYNVKGSLKNIMGHCKYWKSRLRGSCKRKLTKYVLYWCTWMFSTFAIESEIQTIIDWHLMYTSMLPRNSEKIEFAKSHYLISFEI